MVEKEVIYFEQTNKFKRVAEKTRNPVLSNTAAWQEIQPALAYFVEDYPEKYQKHLSLIEELFNIRRNAFLQVIKPGKVWEANKKIIGHLSDEQLDHLAPITSYLQTLFATNGRRV